MKLPPNTYLFKVTADFISGLRGRRRTYDTILKLVDNALFKMVRYVRPPATSEAGARPLEGSCHFKKMNVRGQFHLTKPL
jgi:hypothetical protein